MAAPASQPSRRTDALQRGFCRLPHDSQAKRALLPHPVFFILPLQAGHRIGAQVCQEMYAPMDPPTRPTTTNGNGAAMYVDNASPASPPVNAPRAVKNTCSRVNRRGLINVPARDLNLQCRLFFPATSQARDHAGKPLKHFLPADLGLSGFAGSPTREQ
jgi:hypothetical protein